MTEEFWTFTVHHACTFHNASIRTDTGKSPHHMFTWMLAPWWLEDFRVFGSPAFVLEKRLQDSNSLQKWKSCCWLGVFVGQYLLHAGNVPVIYNPIHVVHYDQFTTVSRPMSTMTDAFYQALYNKATWCYESPVQATSKDFYTFDTYWSGPPLTNTERTLLKDTLNNLKESSAIKPVNTKPALSKRPQPSLSKRAQAEECQQHKLTLSKRSSDPVVTHEDSAAAVSQPLLPEPNLVQSYLHSANLVQWQQENGINASVYSAVLSSDTVLKRKQEFNSGELSTPLSYATVAEQSPAGVDSSSDIGSNIKKTS